MFEECFFSIIWQHNCRDIYLGTNGVITNDPPAAGSGLLNQHVGFCDGKTILVDFSQPAVKLVSTVGS